MYISPVFGNFKRLILSNMSDYPFKIIKDGYVLGAVQRMMNEVPEEELRAKFQEENADELQRLYEVFLANYAMKREAEKNPFLQTKIKDTDLPDSLKQKVESIIYPRTTVGDLAMYTPEDLKRFRRMGAKAIEIIEEFFAKHGISIR